MVGWSVVEPDVELAAHRPELSLDDLGILADVRSALFGLEPRPPRVGRYALHACIGRGGGGRIYRAHDPELGRDVAIKLVIARVQHEARALGRLSHPNVVSVYDVGEHEPEGEPKLFIAMELLRGASLDVWLRADDRAPAAIVDCFVAAARGLAAAHEAGIVHRDLKPSNLFITTEGVLKVLDFGLAGIEAGPVSPTDPSEPEGNAAKRRTAWGGTPWYMAPEQYASGRTDARSDQYSLCFALHEALFGRHRADDLRTLQADKVAGRIAVPRHPKVSRAVRRALRRGLALDPADRFGSMGELAEALAERGGFPNRILLGVGVVLAGVLAVAPLWGATRPAPLAASSAALLEEADEALTRAEDLLDEGRSGEAAELCDRMHEAADLSASADALSTLCRARLHAHHGRYERAAQGFERAYWVATAHHLDGVAALAAARAAANLLATAQIDAALDWVRHGDAAARRASADVGIAQADLATARASAAISKGRYEDALSEYERALALRRRATGPDSRGTATALKLVANCLVRLGRSEEALPMHTQAHARLREILGPDHFDLASALNDRASALQRLDRHDEAMVDLHAALRIAERAGSPDHPITGMIRHNLGVSLARLNRPDEAIAQYQQALRIRAAAHGPDHYRTMLTLSALGQLHVQQGDPQEGERLLLDALARWERSSEPHPLKRSVLSGLAAAARARGDAAVALDYEGRAEAITARLQQEGQQ